MSGGQAGKDRLASDRPQTFGLWARITRSLVYAPLCANACAVFRACAPPSPSAGLCSAPAHYASLRVLATSALRASDGQRLGRECIFTFRTALALRRRGVPCLRTSCARHFSPSGLHLFASICSAKNARNDVHPTIRNGRPAAPEGLQYSLVHWAYYGLFRAQRAAFVRPVISDESLALPILCQCSVAHALPWEWACAYMSAPDEGHIRVWEQAAAVAGGMGHLGPTPAPAAFYAVLPAFATASGALFFERQEPCTPSPNSPNCLTLSTRRLGLDRRGKTCYPEKNKSACREECLCATTLAARICGPIWETGLFIPKSPKLPSPSCCNR